jgi:hypothetical protein
MLDIKMLSSELSSRKNEIIGYENELSGASKPYLEKLPALDIMDASANEKLPRYSGCKVLEEGAFIKKFNKKLASRKEATDWALSILKDKTIAAVDGSQIFPSKEISASIGLAQSYTIINSHKEGGQFSTSAIMSLIFPDDFEEYGSRYVYAEAPVSLKRFELECDSIIDFMDRHKGCPIFFDGSIVLSFINQVEEKLRERYVKKIISMLDASEETKTPVIAYTDLSLNRDLVTLIQKYFMLRYSPYIKDIHLIRSSMAWGDRTRAFLSDRDDKGGKENKSVLDLYGKHRDMVAFFYIQASGGLPSKVEIPLWCYNSGMVDDIADIIRSECIIRPGYPDIIHRAHEYAKISHTENELFNSILESFAIQNNIKLYRSAKEFNKQLRVR